MADDNVEYLCCQAREQLKGVITLLSEAAWMARESDNHELDKSITAVAETLQGSQLLLISLPRLKG